MAVEGNLSNYSATWLAICVQFKSCIVMLLRILDWIGLDWIGLISIVLYVAALNCFVAMKLRNLARSVCFYLLVHKPEVFNIYAVSIVDY